MPRRNPSGFSGRLAIVLLLLAAAALWTASATGAGGFQIGKPKLNPRKGTATVLVSVPALGKVGVSTEKQVSYTEVFFDGPGEAKLAIRPRQGKPVKVLEARGRLAVKPAITFVPQGPGAGSPISKRISLTLKLKD